MQQSRFKRKIREIRGLSIIYWVYDIIRPRSATNLLASSLLPQIQKWMAGKCSYDPMLHGSELPAVWTQGLAKASSQHLRLALPCQRIKDGSSVQGPTDVVGSFGSLTAGSQPTTGDANVWAISSFAAIWCPEVLLGAGLKRSYISQIHPPIIHSESVTLMGEGA